MDGDFTPIPLLPADPEILLATGQFNTDVEVIFGSNSGDGIYMIIPFLANPIYWDAFKDDFVKWKFQLFWREPATEEVEKAHQIINFYIGSIQNLNKYIGEPIIQGQVLTFQCSMLLRHAE